MTIGAVIKRLRESKGLDQKDVAALATTYLDDGTVLTQAVLSQIESGRTHNPGRDRLRAIARALDTPYNAILLEAGWIDPPERGCQGALEELASEHPQLQRKLEQLRDENPEEVYAEARRIVARFFAMGIDTARELTGQDTKTPVGS